jgi:hypothetical protein
MLVLEDSDEDRLYLGKGLPRDWVASGEEIKINQAPTRWGRINFSLLTNPEKQRVIAKVELSRPGEPKQLHVKLRLPTRNSIRSVTVNGRVGSPGGPHNDTVIIETGSERVFEVVGLLS